MHPNSPVIARIEACHFIEGIIVGGHGKFRETPPGWTATLEDWGGAPCVTLRRGEETAVVPLANVAAFDVAR